MTEPKVWLLLGRGVGGNGQMLSLAKALGWPTEAKQLRHNLLNGVPNPVFEWTRPGGAGAATRPLSGWRRWLVEQGWLKPARDFSAYQRALRERGLVTRLDEEPPAGGPVADELGEVVKRIRGLLPAAPGGRRGA